MRYKLPDGISAISAGPMQFEADADGFITVDDDVPAAIRGTLHHTHLHALAPVADAPETVADTDGATADTTVEKPARKKR